MRLTKTFAFEYCVVDSKQLKERFKGSTVLTSKFKKKKLNLVVIHSRFRFCNNYHIRFLMDGWMDGWDPGLFIYL